MLEVYQEGEKACADLPDSPRHGDSSSIVTMVILLVCPSGTGYRICKSGLCVILVNIAESL